MKFNNFFKSKKKILIVILALLILISVVSWYYFVYKSNKISGNLACTSQVNSPLVKTAAEQIYANNITGLASSVHQITRLKNYQQDPNCLYIATSYYLSIGGYQQASSYYHEFTKVYNAKVGFNKNISIVGPSLSKLKLGLAALKQQQAQVNHNSLYF